MKKSFPLFLFFTISIGLNAATLHIGAGQPYPNLSAAANVAQPGDTLLMHAGIYPGGLSITNLKGTPNQWITIKNAPGESVILEGGSNAIQLVEPAYLHLLGLIFQHQTGNGLNTDDGGTYDTPAHHVIFEQCTFRDMSASGNNDLLKLSGLDFFEVRNCLFQNGATGGSGIDMVGCHFGKIIGNQFENMGSNAIQCKGGSENIRIAGNFFKNCGQRALNIGGSTGLQFFRPDTAHFEAARVQVFSNIIIGSQAPVAFVGAVEVDVAHNTIYRPDKWAIRILQETVDPSRFLPCGNNRFRNNIVVLSNANPVVTNIGPNTAPETFTFSNNLWFQVDNPNWNGPDIPVVEPNQIANQNPLFQDPLNEDFSIPTNSPAAGQGLPLSDPEFDFLHQQFANPPSIGAVEANPVSAVFEGAEVGTFQISIFPNPTQDAFNLAFSETTRPKFPLSITLLDLKGKIMFSQVVQSEGNMIKIGHLPKGVYVVRAGNFVGKVVLGL
jgi:hypothetical protein